LNKRENGLPVARPRITWARLGLHYAIGCAVGLAPLTLLVADLELLLVPLPGIGTPLLVGVAFLLVAEVGYAVGHLLHRPVQWLWWGVLTGSVLATIISISIIIATFSNLP